MKVVILGSPGSGKSTFAKRLHQATNLPLIHLDFYYHQPKNDYINHRDEWVGCVKKLMSGKSWIIDGNYQSTIPLRCEAADTIILFDLPRWLCIYRVLKRRVSFHNKQRDDMPSEWVEKVNRPFIKFVLAFNKDQLPRIQAALHDNPNKETVIFTKQAQVDEYLANI